MTSQFWREKNTIYAYLSSVMEDLKKVEMFFSSFWIGFMLSWHNFIHIQRETTSTFYIIPSDSPPPSPPSLHPSSIYSITWQESWYFPWDSMSYCPLTTSNSAHAPPSLSAFAHCLPACNSQRSSSLQIKELCRLCPFSSSSFSSRLSQACVFQGQGDAAHSQTFILLFISHLLPSVVCL